jgi:hypothetical protein
MQKSRGGVQKHVEERTNPKADRRTIDEQLMGYSKGLRRRIQRTMRLEARGNTKQTWLTPRERKAFEKLVTDEHAKEQRAREYRIKNPEARDQFAGTIPDPMGEFTMMQSESSGMTSMMDPIRERAYERLGERATTDEALDMQVREKGKGVSDLAYFKALTKSRVARPYGGMKDVFRGLETASASPGAGADERRDASLVERMLEATDIRRDEMEQQQRAQKYPDSRIPLGDNENLTPETPAKKIRRQLNKKTY